MKIYFNSLGVITSVDTSQDQLRQGSVGIKLEAIFDEVTNINYIATFNFKRSDGSIITGVTMTPDSSDEEKYNYTFNDPWYFAKAGTTKVSIYLHDGSGNIIAQGQAQFSIEQTDYEPDSETITEAQYDALLELLAALPESLVPYTDATKHVNLGSHDLSARKLRAYTTDSQGNNAGIEINDYGIVNYNYGYNGADFREDTFEFPEYTDIPGHEFTLATEEWVRRIAGVAGALPQVTISGEPLIIDFLVQNNLINKPFITNYHGVIYIMTFHQMGGANSTVYAFEIEELETEIRYQSDSINLTGFYFYNLLNNTYKHNFELEDNKVDLGSENTINQYPNAKSVWDECQNIREVAEGKCKSYVISYDQTNPNPTLSCYYDSTTDSLIDFEDLTDRDNWISGKTLVNSSFNVSADSSTTQLQIASRTSDYLILYGSDKASLVHKSYVYIRTRDFSNILRRGDLVLVTQTDVLDWWYDRTFGGAVDYITFRKLETSKVDLTNYYTKSEDDALLALKADKSDTYTKSETDAKVDSVKQIALKASDAYQLSCNETIASVKTVLNRAQDGFMNKAYLYFSMESYLDAQTPTDITDAIRNGDYDDVSLQNSIFNSPEDTIDLKYRITSASNIRYLILKRKKGLYTDYLFVRLYYAGNCIFLRTGHEIL